MDNVQVVINALRREIIAFRIEVRYWKERKKSARNAEDYYYAINKIYAFQGRINEAKRQLWWLNDRFE